MLALRAEVMRMALDGALGPHHVQHRTGRSGTERDETRLTFGITVFQREVERVFQCRYRIGEVDAVLDGIGGPLGLVPFLVHARKCMPNVHTLQIGPPARSGKEPRKRAPGDPRSPGYLFFASAFSMLACVIGW